MIGADSIATSSAAMGPVVQIPSNSKISVFGNVIVAATGSVGFGQRLSYHVDAAVKAKNFSQLSAHDCLTGLSRRVLNDFQNSGVQTHPQVGLQFGALLAAPIGNVPHLVEYDAKGFQPETKEDRLFYVSMGSGQSLADPFLAFVCRVLWNDAMPSVKAGKVGVYWTLSHTIRLAPGYVGPPIKLATLRQVDGVWKIDVTDDDQEAEQHVAELENHIGAFALKDVVEAGAQPLPEPPPSK